MLKAVIFSLRNVLALKGANDRSVLKDTIKLLKFLKQRGVEPVFLSNHHWTINVDGKGAMSFKDFLEKQIGSVRYFVGGSQGVPRKPTAAVTEFIREVEGWKTNEVIYVGNSENDMRTAKNGKLLFLNAMWHGEATQYGFQFSSAGDVARFIDCVCLGLDDWYWKIEQDPLRVYAMAPYTTMSAKYIAAHEYSAGARAAAKDRLGEIDFWGRLLAARVYFSGLGQEIDYVTAYPGHAPDSKHTVIESALNTLGQSVAKAYLPDLFIRHKKAVQSHAARNANRAVAIGNQLTTIRLNPNPSRGVGGKVYVRQPVVRGATILLVDDFCTEGNSFEAGRAFLEALGARVICLSWLKTINTDYKFLAAPINGLDPYSPLAVSPALTTKPITFSVGEASTSAPSELADVYRRYISWDWPNTKV